MGGFSGAEADLMEMVRRVCKGNTKLYIYKQSRAQVRAVYSAHFEAISW